MLAETEPAEAVADPFDVAKIIDARRRVAVSVVSRQGQADFRSALLTAYGRRCAVTGCDVEAVLEAAHISPYRGPYTNHVANGLLLRADIRTLFDLGLLTVDPRGMRLVLSPGLSNTKYGELTGIALSLPKDRQSWPNADALQQHKERAGL